MSRPYMPFSPGDVRDLTGQLDRLGFTPPPALARAAEVIAVTEAERVSDDAHPCLDMSDEQILEYARGRALRIHPQVGPHPYSSVLVAIGEQAALEAGDRLRAGEVDQIIEALRPRFDKAAAAYARAAGLGITSTTTAEQILAKRLATVTEAWYALDDARSVLEAVAAIRIRLSNRLDVSPTWRDFDILDDATIDRGAIDYTAAFAAADDYSTDFGRYLRRSPAAGIDWLGLAAGSLRLNTPSEVKAKYAARWRTLHPAVPLDQTAPRRG